MSRRNRSGSRNSRRSSRSTRRGENPRGTAFGLARNAPRPVTFDPTGSFRGMRRSPSMDMARAQAQAQARAAAALQTRADLPVLAAYLADPVDLLQMVQFDDFRKDVCINRTNFEEMEVFAPLCDPIDPTVLESGAPPPDEPEDEGEGEVEEDLPVMGDMGAVTDAMAQKPDELQLAVNRIFHEYLTTDVDRTTPLTSFHMLLYKRLQILTSIQALHQTDRRDFAQAKASMERLPFSSGRPRTVADSDELAEVLRSLEKAMAKKDAKRGLFSKFGTTRFSAVHRVLVKEVTPLKLKGVDVQRYREYLRNFTSSTENSPRARCKTLKSLLLLAIGTGKLSDMMVFLHLLATFVPDHPLCPDASETPQEGDESYGLLLEDEDAEALGRMYQYCSRIVIQSPEAAPFLSEPEYQIHSQGARPVSVETLFFYVLGLLDKIVVHLLYGGRSVAEMNLRSICGGVDYSLEPVAEVFQILVFLLNNATTEWQLQMDESKKSFLVAALLRILRVNLDTLCFWKGRNEAKQQCLARMGCPNETSLFRNIKALVFRLMQLPGTTKNAFESCTGIAADSLSVFVSNVEGQKNYVLSILAKNPMNQIEAVVLNKVLANLIENGEYYTWFVIDGVAGNKAQMDDFVKRFLSFVEFHLDRMLQTGVLEADATISSIIDRILSVLLLWQNYLSYKVTPVYTRFQKSVNASPSTLESPIGKLFLQLIKDVLRYSCAFLAKVVASDRCAPENGAFIDALLKKSFVGKLLFPTMQSMVRLLWKSDQRVKYYLYHLTSFIYTSLLALLKNVNAINVVFSPEDPKFEYSIVETDHPYIANIKTKLEARFPKDRALYTAIVFHPRCRTAQSSDALVIAPGLNTSSSQPLKFSGVGNTIPVNPLVAWGPSMILSFSSGERDTDWGMKCTVLPILRYSWMYELEKCVAWVGGRISTYVMSAFPIADDEMALARWLGSRLFANGLEEVAPTPPALAAVVGPFLQGVMEKGGVAKSFVEFIDGRMRMEVFVGRGNPDIEAAERAIVAVLMKHSDLVGVALAFSRKLGIVEDPRDLRMSIPNALLQLWRAAGVIRTWMMQKKQQEELEYPSIRDAIVANAKFLLGIQRATYGDMTDEDVVLVSSPESPPDAVQAVIDKFVKVRGDPAVVDNVTSISNIVLPFVQDAHDLRALRKAMLKRKERALCRHKALDMYNQFISRTKYPTVKAEVIRELFTVLRTSSMKKPDSNDFHYFNNCEGGGFEFLEKCQKSFDSFVKHLIAGTDLSDPDLVKSGLVRIVLSTATISFKPADIKWVMNVDLLEKLSPLLYDAEADSDDSEVGFKLKMSSGEERKELNRRAWKIFRLLSIRCVDILEDWEAGDKYQMPLDVRLHTKSLLDAARDRVFQMVFENFERMIKTMTFVESVLQEMLSLLVSLLKSESAQAQLSSERLRSLILPLIQYDSPKLQQLALQLYALKVFSSSGTGDDPPEFMDRFTTILFDLLGRYEMTQVFGNDPFDDSHDIVGLDLAKECFQMARRMLRPRSPPGWRKVALAKMKAYMIRSGQLFQAFASGSRKSLSGVTPQEASSITRTLAAFVVYAGLDHVPLEGELVSARLFGRWEDARVVFVEESRHVMKIVLKTSSGIERTQRVNSENIRVLTNEVIDPEHFGPDPDVIASLSSFIRGYGNVLFSEDANDYSEPYHLLFSCLWQMGLKILHDCVSEMVLDPGLAILPDIVTFAKNVTPIVYGMELKLHTCTFTFTGKELTTQYFYPCFTCSLTQDKSVCVFCAMNCHRGHQLGPAKKGNASCSCGSGAAKCRCISKEVPPQDPILSCMRMESLFLRLRTLLPISASRREQDQSFISSAGAGRESQANFAAPTQWVNPSKTTGYTLKRSVEISFTWHNARGFSMVGSDHSVPPIYTGFYFEIEIVRRGGRRGGVAMGFAESVNQNKAWPQVLEGSYTHHVLHRRVYRGMQFFEEQPNEGAVSRGDVFGCGWSKTRKEVYFTKNGKLLPVKLTNVPPRVYYPVILLQGEDSSVRANLGAKRFRYDAHGSRSEMSPRSRAQKQERSVKIQRDGASESLKLKTSELCSLGHEQKNCLRALSKYSDLNSAAAYLHRRAMRPVRYQLSDRLVQMGFDRALAIKALEVSNDEVNQALSWLLEENHVPGQPAQQADEDVRVVSQNRGVPFLGSNIDDQKVKEEIIKGLLNSHTKVNDNAFPPIPCGSVVPVDSLVVVNPFMTLGERGANVNTERLKGRCGIVQRKVQGGGYVQCVDPESGAFLSSFVSSENMVAVPPELRGTKMDQLPVECIKACMNIGIVYCRRIATFYLAHADRIPIDRTFTSSPNLYSLMKFLFLEQYHEQSHNFVANIPKLSSGLEKMMHHLEDVTVLDGRREISFFDYLAPEALNEITMFQEGMPFHRKIIFKNTYNNKRILIRFWGCSAVFLSFSRKCVLPTQYDYLSFFYGETGKQCEYFVGSKKAIPRYLVIPGDRFWFEFRTVKLTEAAEFQFHVTPVAFRMVERLAVSQPNVALSSVVLRNGSNEFWRRNIELAKKTFEISINYLMTPFAPFKGTVGNAVESLIAELYDSESRPNLNIIKAFRVELEDLYISFKKRSETTDWPLPIYHSLVELMSIFRHYLSTDLCRSVFPYQDCHQHMYNFRFNQRGGKVQDVVTCTACAMNDGLRETLPRYRSHSFESCGVKFSKHFTWRSDTQRREYSNLVPIQNLRRNPADWFEHTSWIDQLSIVRDLLRIFVGEKPLPNWFLYEAAMETRRRIFTSQTDHPYTVVNGEGEFLVPNARVLYVSFDRHSATSPLDVLCFSARRRGETDLGCLKGNQMHGKTYIIQGNKIYFQFRCDGGDHKCRCKGCRRGITGIRFHCCHPECDGYELCANCISRRGLHPETHIFLKIRRPVDWLPAALPQLYTRRWSRTATYRGSTHVGIGCDACGKNPIVGIRYWCENCEEYNLCEQCGDREYRHHNRKHVFLRVVRPLPARKSDLPANHLPYGGIYDKDKDLHWGYLFTVTTAEKYMYDDRVVQQLMATIQEDCGGWDLATDAQLVHYVEEYGAETWLALNWKDVRPTRRQLMNFPQLAEKSLRSIQHRFLILKLLNRKIAATVNLVNMETATVEMAKTHTNISTLLALTRRRIFGSIKRDVWFNTLEKTSTDMKPVDLTVNRQVAADAKSSTDKLTAASKSLFNQTYVQLQSMNPRVLSAKTNAWKCTFVGESADDYGGPFRESLSQFCAELQSEQLDLFIRVPNATHAVGENREKFMPNPRARSYLHMSWYRFVGVLMGVGMLSGNVLPLDLPSMFWKQFVKERVTLGDLEGIDQMVCQSMENLRTIHLKGIDASTFEDVIMEKFTTHGSDGIEIELVRGGRQKDVTFENRDEYADLVEQARLSEIETQVEAVREGLFSIVPSRFSPLFSWNELEVLICGKNTIDLKVLQKHSVYEEYRKNGRVVKTFWRVLESFTARERSLYLRFVWGRSRLPISEDGFTHPHKVQKLQRRRPDQVLPLSHTCFFSIELPAYSSYDIMREKLLYAITNCRAIDTDHTRNARNARNMSD